MNIEDIYRQQIETPLIHYQPVSASIKPVHVANGLFRALLGVGPTPNAFHDTLVRYKTISVRGKGRTRVEIKAARELAAEYGEQVFGKFASPANTDRLNLLRAYLRAAYAADEAVFPDMTKSSYTLTNRSQITSDTNDFRTGRFLARILTADFGSGRSPIIPVLEKLLRDDTDELSTIALPLLKTMPQEQLQEQSWISDGLDEGVKSSAIVRSIRWGFDSIARHAEPFLQGDKLRILRYVTMFSCFSIYLHLINLDRQTSPYHQGKSLTVPILVDWRPSSRQRIRYASRATYRIAIKEIESLILNGFRTYLSETCSSLNSATADAVISQIELPRRGSVSDLRDAFKAYSIENTDPLEALSKSITDAFYRNRTATPESFARNLGVRIGFVAPGSSRVTNKHYAMSPDLLEVLVLSVTNADDAVGDTLTITDLTKRWRDRYGIVTGALPDDYEFLSYEGVQDAAHDDLEVNALSLQETLVSIGKAREYADGVAIIYPSMGSAL